MPSNLAHPSTGRDTPPTRRRLSAAGWLAAVVVAIVVPAQATTAQASVVHRSGARASHPHRAHPKARHRAPAPRPPAPAPASAVTVAGVVVGAHGRTVRVWTSTGSVGRTNLQHHLLTVALPGSAAPARARRGDRIALTGRGRAAKDTVVLTSAAAPVVTATPARAWAGVVTGLDPVAGTLTVATRHHADDEGGDDGAAPGGPRLVVSLATATLTRDGSAATAADLQPGDLVVVLGENAADATLAASVHAFSAGAQVMVGRVSAVSGSVVSLREHGSLDLAPGGSQVPLVLNGNEGATADQLRRGDTLLVVGTAPTSAAQGDDEGDDEGDDQGAPATLLPSIAFAFNGADDGPVGTNDD